MRIVRQNDTWYAALRIAIGARLISGVVFDPMLGDSPEERLGTRYGIEGCFDDFGKALDNKPLLGRTYGGRHPTSLSTHD